MKKIENTFVVSGFVGKDAEVREFDKTSVARFSLAVSRGEKDKEGNTHYTSAFVNIEVWRKNQNKSTFDIIKKGEMVTCEGYFKPENWTAEDGIARSRVTMVANKVYVTPEKADPAPQE